MPRLSNKSTLSSRLSCLKRELKKLLSPAPQTSQVGVEGKLIAMIDIASSSNMEHTSTAGRVGASTGVSYIGVSSGVIYTGFITIHHINVVDGNVANSGNVNDADNSIVWSSSLSYWWRTTKQTKEEILQHRVVCVKKKRDPEGSRKRDIHHANATKVISQTFGSRNYFVPKNLEGESESTKYIYI